ncbi:MAG: hypothetical protein JZU65_23525 [Chlorobium sp.]|nr:hypothetical protein [Chlorobium sp.]
MNLVPLKIVTIVGCCYHLTPNEFARWLVNQAAKIGLQLQGVIISNNALHPLNIYYSSIRVQTGSNEYLDFSGYFEGLQSLQSETPEIRDVILFVNDSLITKHSGALILRKTLAHIALCREMRCAAIVGKADNYTSICLKNPWSGTQMYISSFCFMLNHQGQSLLNQMLEFAHKDNILDMHRVHDDDWGANIDSRFCELVRAHLIYGNSPYSWRKDYAVHFDEDILQKKSRCCYFEHRLTGAISAEGALIPINTGFKARTHIFLGEQLAKASKWCGKILSNKKVENT